mgnify:CR=1 FL=1
MTTPCIYPGTVTTAVNCWPQVYYYPYYTPQQQKCPSCGYCPCCGRSDAAPAAPGKYES